MMATVLPKRTFSWGCPFSYTIQIIRAAKKLPHKHIKPLHRISSDPTHAFNRSNKIHFFLDEASYKKLFCRFLLFFCPLYFATIPPPAPGLPYLSTWVTGKVCCTWLDGTETLEVWSAHPDDHPADYCPLQQLSCSIPSSGGISNLWRPLPWGY